MTPESFPGTSRPALRAVLLGASNLAIALPAIIERLRRAADGPVEVLAACGHGRSYGEWSRYLWFRELPGIAGCGLWGDLAARPPLPTVALLTDIGNDLAYGEPAARIASWIGACLELLSAARAETVLTLLPTARLLALPAWQFHLARTVFFPGRQAERRDVFDRLRQLDPRLRRLGEQAGAHLVEPDSAWYGIDPIHFRRRKAREAWDRILAPWPLDCRGLNGERFRRLVRRPPGRPEELRLAGLTRRHEQPSGHFADGTTIALY
ncbi:MAG TPA: hypothetical protein VOA87_08490 [Thermoanaerobaculia bacterium]|nr:hypothetical protein [Thermoanaerobaculia bacterium]